jgi:hypothetical protein
MPSPRPTATTNLDAITDAIANPNGCPINPNLTEAISKSNGFQPSHFCPSVTAHHLRQLLVQLQGR